MVPYFSNETVGKPMSYGSRALVRSVTPIWTKEQISCFLNQKSLKMWVSYFFYSSPVFFFSPLSPILSFLFDFLFLFLFFPLSFPSSFMLFINIHTSWTRKLFFNFNFQRWLKKRDNLFLLFCLGFGSNNFVVRGGNHPKFSPTFF